MKRIFILFFLFSCTTSRFQRKIQDPNMDAFKNESFQRWSDHRLNQLLISENKGVPCYQGRSKDVLEQLKKDYFQNNRSSDFWLIIGNCFFMDENWNKSEFFYRLALEESKVAEIKSMALNNLALIQFRYNLWEEGREYLIQSISLKKDFKVPRFNLSQLYLQFGLYDDVITLLENEEFGSIQDVDIFFTLGSAYFFKGEVVKAQTYFNKVAPEEFLREDMALTYALFLINIGNPIEAKKLMKRRKHSDIPEISFISKKIEKLISEVLKED